MTWLAWRQFRTQGVVVLAAVALVAVALAVTRPGVVALRRDDPDAFLARFASGSTHQVLYLVATAVVYAMPAVVGAFWGAPLVAREVEAGTLRLAWTQSVSRTRWLSTKLGVVGPAALVAGALSLLMTWWCLPLDQTISTGGASEGVVGITRLSAALLGARGIVPVAYVVVALVLGVAGGLVVRRTVPAMALTVLGVVAVQVAMPLWVLPHLLAPETATVAITADDLRGMYVEDDGAVHEIKVRVDRPGAWVTTNETVDARGATVAAIASDAADCTPEARGERTSAGPTTTCFEQLAAAGYRQRVEYQPASRYWTLQWLQTGVLLVLAAAVAGFCLWTVRRDVT